MATILLLKRRIPPKGNWSQADSFRRSRCSDPYIKDIWTTAFQLDHPDRAARSRHVRRRAEVPGPPGDREEDSYAMQQLWCGGCLGTVSGGVRHLVRARDD